MVYPLRRSAQTSGLHLRAADRQLGEPGRRFPSMALVAACGRRGRGFDTWLVGPSRAESDASFHAAHPDLDALSPEERLQVQLSGVFVQPAAKRAVELVPRARSGDLT